MTLAVYAANAQQVINCTLQASCICKGQSCGIQHVALQCPKPCNEVYHVCILGERRATVCSKWHTVEDLKDDLPGSMQAI